MKKENTSKYRIEPPPTQPPMAERYKALFMDAMTVLAVLGLYSFIFTLFEHIYVSIKWAIYLATVTLYEPLCLTVCGATVGHYLGGMRVTQESKPEQNIPFMRALLRSSTKLLLGAVSFFSISSGTSVKALHDVAAKSVVLYTPTQIG